MLPVSTATTREGGRVWAATASSTAGSQRAPSWLTRSAVTVGYTAPNPSWARALGAFDTALRTRGLGEQTRRAYGADLGQHALHQLGPEIAGLEGAVLHQLHSASVFVVND